MEDTTLQRMTGKELAELLRVTPSAISRAALNDTLVRDIAPVAMWADLDPDSDRVRGFDVPAEDVEMLRQMALAGQFASHAGAIPRASVPAGRSTDFTAGQYPAVAVPAPPPLPVVPSRTDADIERVVSLLQQQIEARDAEVERVRQLLVRTEQEASSARSEHLRALDDLRERMAKMRDEHADAAAKLREDLAQAHLDLRAYEAGAEPLSGEGTSSIWEQLASEYAPVLVPAAAGLLSSLGSRMKNGAAPSAPLQAPAPATAPAAAQPPQPESPAPQAMPAESPQVATAVAGYLMQAALQGEGQGFGPYLDQLTSLLSMDDWKAVVPPLLADLSTRDLGTLARSVTPVLMARWAVAFAQTPDQVVAFAASMGMLSSPEEQAVLHRVALALHAEAAKLARGPHSKTPLRPAAAGATPA